MTSLKINPESFIYEAMIGTGGIGSGMFFLLNGNHTLGREESRSGRLDNRNDYCKLHIIAHYVKTLLGNKFLVYPVGRIGNDAPGKALLQEMNEAGMDTSFVECDQTRPTLFSFCFIYPDNSGGNMTTDDSASSAVCPSSILKAGKLFSKYVNKGIALAVPEVPLSARKQLLDLATEYHFFRAASFTSGEMDEVLSTDILNKIDLLTINLDEASRTVEIKSADDPASIAHSAVTALLSKNPDLKLTITNGKNGSWSCDGKKITYFPSLNINVISTAGAGDAFTAGVIAGISAGLNLQQAQQLGTLTGGASVTSPHTINKDLDKGMLKSLSAMPGYHFSKEVLKLLED